MGGVGTVMLLGRWGIWGGGQFGTVGVLGLKVWELGISVGELGLRGVRTVGDLGRWWCWD